MVRLANMYSLVQTIDKAHDSAIKTCDWRSVETSKLPVVRGLVGLSYPNDDFDAGYNNRYKAVADRPWSDRIVTGCRNGIVKIWNNGRTAANVNYEKSLAVADEPMCTGSVLCVTFNSDTSMVAFSTIYQTAALWDTATGKKLRSFTVGNYELWQLTFSPNDKYIASGNNVGNIVLYGVKSGLIEHTFYNVGGKNTTSAVNIRPTLKRLSDSGFFFLV